MTDELPLAAEFPAATREDWLKLVRAALKDRPFERLTAKTYDGLAIEPLYPPRQDARPIAARTGPWQVMARVDHPDPAAANAQALQDLENGATGLTLVCAGSINANGYGIDGSAETLARVLDGVFLDAGIVDRLQRQPGNPRHRPALRGAGEAAQHRARGGRAARQHQSDRRHGRGRRQSATLERSGAGLRLAWSANLPAQGFRGPFAVADGRIVHNAGGSEAQELAFAIASAVAYLRALEAGGIAARCGARHDLFPALRRCRPVPDHRQVPGAAEIVGAGRAGLRPRAEARLRFGRDRLAHDDAARPLREPAAHHHCGVLGRRRRRRCDRRAAAHRRARPARSVRAADRAQHPAPAAGGIQPRQGCRSGRRIGRARRPHRQALQRRLDAVPGIRARGRRRAGARTRPDPEQDRRGARRAREGDRAAQGCAHRHQRLSRSGRNAGRRCST